MAPEKSFSKKFLVYFSGNPDSRGHGVLNPESKLHKDACKLISHIASSYFLRRKLFLWKTLIPYYRPDLVLRPLVKINLNLHYIRELSYKVCLFLIFSLNSILFSLFLNQSFLGKRYPSFKKLQTLLLKALAQSLPNIDQVVPRDMKMWFVYAISLKTCWLDNQSTHHIYIYIYFVSILYRL